MCYSSNRPGPARAVAATALIAIALAASNPVRAEVALESLVQPGAGPLLGGDTLLGAAGALTSAAVGLNSAAVGIAEKPAPKPRPHAPASLRCWQYGRLLFEESNLEPSPNALVNTRQWQRAAPDVASPSTSNTPLPSLHLIQMGDAICLFADKAAGR